MEPPRRRAPAAERLEWLLDYLEHPITGLPFGKTFNDSGFNEQLQDPWPATSGNQVGHFLTAVALGYSPTTYVRTLRLSAPVLANLNSPSPMGTVVTLASISDEEAAIRLIVGHEMLGDYGLSVAQGQLLSAALSRNFSQYDTASSREVRTFLRALHADMDGDIEARDCFIQEITGLSYAIDPEAYPHRIGNSSEDLLLSLKGWRFGQMIKQGQLTTLHEAETWLATHLR